MSYRAYLAFSRHGILPHEFMALPCEEQAFLLACDLTEQDERREDAERTRRRMRRR
ncbi:hypothetical protein ACS3UN_10385 [Oscillospiraceae bacterium LTW-04]|nr:hypothetical protein RBH76_12135 [Oscillospiraceae bacterium MB24-C1]